MGNDLYLLELGRGRILKVTPNADIAAPGWVEVVEHGVPVEDYEKGMSMGFNDNNGNSGLPARALICQEEADAKKKLILYSAAGHQLLEYETRDTETVS